MKKNGYNKKSQKNSRSNISKEKQKNKNNVLSKRAIFVVFLLFLFYIGGYFIASINKNMVSATEIVSGNIELPVILNGVIIRDEEIYRATTDGEIVHLVSDLSKIKNKTATVSIQKHENSENLKKELVNINKKILDLQELRDDLSTTQKDAKHINDQIKNSLDSNIFNFSYNNIENFYDLKENIEDKINMRNQLLLNENRGSIASLVKEREKKIQELIENEDYIISENSGIVCYTVDDMEEIFTFSNMEEIRKEQVIGNLKTKELVTNKIVRKDDPIFKIIKSNSWYIATYIENEYLDGFLESSSKIIYIEKDKSYFPVSAKIDKIKNYNSNSLIIFKLTKNMLDFVENRKIRFKTSDDKTLGLKIPKTSIITKKIFKIPLRFLNNDIYLSKKNQNESFEDIKINIWKQDEEYAIILEEENTLQLGDVIIDKHEEQYTINNRDEIKGVFKINSNITNFIQIFFDEEQNSNKGLFVILDPETNPNLKVYDVVVTDAQNTKDRELIYKK